MEGMGREEEKAGRGEREIELWEERGEGGDRNADEGGGKEWREMGGEQEKEEVKENGGRREEEEQREVSY